MNPSPDERMLLLASRCRIVISRLVLLCSLLSATVSCGSLPRDPERTTDRVRKQHQIRVGLVEKLALGHSCGWPARRCGSGARAKFRC